jgi:Mg/Co/Ni transporter MgtE
MPNHGKLIFDKRQPEDLREVFMDSSRNEIDLLISILKYDRRAKASEVLKMPYFTEYPPALPKLLPEERLADIEVMNYDDIFQVKNKTNN